MIDTGHGSPIVLIPGLQGRLEWMAPAIEALSARHRVLSFSLGETNGADPFPGWLDIVDRLVDRTAERRVTLIGVSYGGLIAVRYAARHPERVGALVLVASPSPRFKLDRVSAACAKYPRAALPLHEHCLFKLGLPLGELWWLAELAAWLRAHGRHRFLLTAPPLRLPGAVGSPVTPVATV